MNYITYVFCILSTLSTVALFPLHRPITALAQGIAQNAPTVRNVGTTSATFSYESLKKADQSRFYFEYDEPEKACIMIYPTPEECLPKKTPQGETTVTVTNLKPGTKYAVVYKLENTIRCIKAPCPENGTTSAPTVFTTKGAVVPPTLPPAPSPIAPFQHNFGFRSSGTHVTSLQSILSEYGFMVVRPTGYFGPITLQAVKDYQKANNIPPTGYVGPLTRASLNGYIQNGGTPRAPDTKADGGMPVNPQNGTSSPSSNTKTERFSGKIDAVSTACFADGECSITIDGKKVITTIGWVQANALGSIKGVPSIGDAEKCIGSRARIYAEKVDQKTYTLYGNNAYYVDILGCGLE
jgi:peptidoglycan hydrolase-like protein with peptidoglycan-binding domain